MYGSRRPGPLISLYLQTADSGAETRDWFRAKTVSSRARCHWTAKFSYSTSAARRIRRFTRRHCLSTGNAYLSRLSAAPSRWYVGARISPDGHWVAYVSDQESGQHEVYVKSYPSGESKWKISPDGGMEVVWGRDGRELYWRNENKNDGRRFRRQEQCSTGNAKGGLRRAGYASGLQAMAQYDVARDGRFVMVQEGAPASPPAQLNVVISWHDETEGAGRRVEAMIWAIP